MHQPTPIDVHLITDTADGETTHAKQPWEAPTLDVLPLRETYNNPNINSDAGMIGS